MTKAKAAEVVSALVTAGYLATVELDNDGSYIVYARGIDIPTSTAASFAATQGIIATTNNVKLV